MNEFIAGIMLLCGPSVFTTDRLIDITKCEKKIECGIGYQYDWMKLKCRVKRPKPVDKNGVQE